MWPFSVVPRRPAGVSIDEARLAGIEPPAGWQAPPRAPLDATARMVAAIALTVPSVLRRMVNAGGGDPPAATTSEAGLAEIASSCRAALARLRVSLEVTGVDRVPRTGGLVFMWNQASHLDHLVLPPAMPRVFHSIYNNELRQTPLYGRYLARSGHFWVDRNDESQWRASLAEAAACVRAGACMLVSPEGTRSWDGRLLPMKRGAFILARQAERPIVCATVIGAHACLPRGCAVVRPGAIRVDFSDPIPVRTGDETLEAKVAATFERALGN